MKNLGNIVSDLDVATKGYVDKKIKNLGGGTGGGGGASIPVVSSEEELESLSQNKGDLAVILSDDEIKNGNVRCLDLPSISMTAVQAYNFSECASVQGIAINTEVDVPPCPAFAGQNIQFMIVPRKMNSPATATFFGFDLSEELDADGYLRGALQVTLIENGSSSSAVPFAQYDEATGKMVANVDALVEIDAFIGMIEDPVFVSMSEMLAAGGDGLKDTFAFFECISSVASFGTKSIRVKNDKGYSRLDSDVIRTVPKDAVPNLKGLKMPNASQVRVYFPDETVYDTDPKDFKCCITEPSINTANATVVNKIEFIKTCDTTISSGSNPLPPYIILCNQSLDKKLSIRWVAGETAPYKAMYSEDEWATSVILLENGVWNEENLEALDAIIASGVNILFELGKNNENGSGDDVNIYNPKTGVMTYLEDYGEDGSLTEEDLAAISLLVTMLFGSYFTIFANERVIPEHIESYSRMEGKWVKDEMKIETEWSESSPTSNKPIATSLFVALMRDYDDDIRKELDSKQPKLVSGENIATVNGKSLLEGGDIVIKGGEGGGSNITVDSALSTTSTNPVQNAVITTELNKKVNAESGKGLSTNDYTTTDKNKLSSIAANAEVNVQSDWNATSGDAFIKNKPTFATINGKRIDQGGEIVVEGGSGSGEKEAYRVYEYASSAEEIEANTLAFHAALSQKDCVFYLQESFETRIEASRILATGSYVELHFVKIETDTGRYTSILIGERVVQLGDAGDGVVTTNTFYYQTVRALDEVQINALLSKKQDELVSEVNIKTINGVSLLGKGNIQLGGAVIFDATCANDIYDLPELQTTTEVQTIIDAIATSQPIYAQFAVSMIPATVAYLANGFPHLLLQTVDAEDGKARMLHIYAYEEGWTWERFEMELGGAAGTFVKSVNGVTPDDNGNVQIEVTIDGEVVDTTLSTLVGSGSTFTLEELIG